MDLAQTAANQRFFFFLVNSVDGLSQFELAVPAGEQRIHFWGCKRGRDCTNLLQVQSLKLFFSQVAMPGIFCSGFSVAYVDVYMNCREHVHLFMGEDSWT